MTRKTLQRLHRWIGLLLALPLIIQAATGLIMAADPFVAALQGPATPAAAASLSAPSDLRGVDVAAVLAVAGASAPADLVPRRYRVLPGSVVAVDYGTAGRQSAVAQVVLDAGSMTVLAVRQHPDGLYRWVHSVHETLLMGLFGRGLVGWIGIGLLFLALSGIPLWWPPRNRWRRGFTVTRGATGWRFQRELHGAAGIWVLVLLLLQSVSGIAMAFPQIARAVVGLPEQPRGGRSAGSETVAQDARVAAVRSMVAGIAAAQAAMPDATLQDLRLPGAPGRPMAAFLQPAGTWQGAPRAVVFMEPVTARVLSAQDPQTQATGASLLDWLRSLHDGSGLGPVWRVVICLSGVGLLLFPVTGVAMWVLRRRAQAAPPGAARGRASLARAGE